jgi:hypothetical protein
MAPFTLFCFINWWIYELVMRITPHYSYQHIWIALISCSLFCKIGTYNLNSNMYLNSCSEKKKGLIWTSSCCYVIYFVMMRFLLLDYKFPPPVLVMKLWEYICDVTSHHSATFVFLLPNVADNGCPCNRVLR